MSAERADLFGDVKPFSAEDVISWNLKHMPQGLALNIHAGNLVLNQGTFDRALDEGNIDIVCACMYHLAHTLSLPKSAERTLADAYRNRATRTRDELSASSPSEEQAKIRQIRNDTRTAEGLLLFAELIGNVDQ